MRKPIRSEEQFTQRNLRSAFFNQTFIGWIVADAFCGKPVIFHSLENNSSRKVSRSVYMIAGFNMEFC